MLRRWGLPVSSQPWSTCTLLRRAQPLPPATSRSTSRGWSRRGWWGWRCSWWSRWPTSSSGALSSWSPLSTGAGSGRMPRSQCLMRWQSYPSSPGVETNNFNNKKFFNPGLSSCGFCPLLCQSFTLCRSPQRLQVRQQCWEFTEYKIGPRRRYLNNFQKARNHRPPMLQLLPVLDQGDTFLFPPRWKVKNTRAFHEAKRKKTNIFLAAMLVLRWTTKWRSLRRGTQAAEATCRCAMTKMSQIC